MRKINFILLMFMLTACNLGTSGTASITEDSPLTTPEDVITPFSITQRAQPTSIFGATDAPRELNFTGQLVYSRYEDSTGWDIFTMFANGTGIVNITNSAGDDKRPKWSPDGTQIAFDSNRTGNQEIFLMNPDGSNLRNITNNSATDLRASWSPDGSQIVFHSNRSGSWDIWLMNADGSNP